MFYVLRSPTLINLIKVELSEYDSETAECKSAMIANFTITPNKIESNIPALFNQITAFIVDSSFLSL